MTVPHIIVRTASLLLPATHRTEWLRGWCSELYYIPAHRAAAFSLGAFRDAMDLRRTVPPANPVDSPTRTLAIMAAFAVLGSGVTLWIAGSHALTPQFHITTRQLPLACCVTLMYSVIFWLTTRIAMGRDAAKLTPATWRQRLRLNLFLALKILLAQPILLGSLFAFFATARIAPFVPQFGLLAAWIFTFRWILADQRSRCPICLHLLTNPVRIGSPSQTLLAWYGAESVCSRGHGLLHTSQSWPSYSEEQEWHRLDASWDTLFTEARQ